MNHHRFLLCAALAWLAALLLPLAASASGMRTLTLPYHGVLIGSGTLNEDFAGVGTFSVPSSWAVLQKNAHYDMTPPAAGACTFLVQVNNVPTLTTASTQRQVAATFPEGFRKVALGRGRRAHGSWGADETSFKETPTHRRVYAVGVIRLHGHLYGKIRVIATFDGPCSDDEVRSGDVTAQAIRIARTATFRGHRLSSSSRGR
jgi:hypothetical protein